MYAIIEASGGQVKVTQGMEVELDLIDGGEATPGKALSFDKVLLISGEDGKAPRIGTPYVAGASVSAEVIEGLVKGPKLRIQYFQAKKGSRRRTGHRQQYTKVRITGIKG
jgi:large subunit ribosomal protein L21